MDQVGQQVQRGEQVGQELLAVSEVVVEMVALGFQSVVVLVLDFPPRPPGGSQRGDVVVGDGMRGGPGVLEEESPAGIGGDQFQPVGHHGLVRVTQGHLMSVAIVSASCRRVAPVRRGRVGRCARNRRPTRSSLAGTGRRPSRP